MTVDHFWVQFLRNYLLSLQVSQNWQQHTNNLQKTVVMITDPQLPHTHWSIVQVVKLNASADGRIQSAEVQVVNKAYLRPVHAWSSCPLFQMTMLTQRLLTQGLLVTP